jgi:hypothetical protein
MITLYLRYTIDPNKSSDFAKYAAEEQIPISESGGNIVGYFLPTDFAGSTSEAVGLIDFPSLTEYERYRSRLATHPLHLKNVALLRSKGAVLSTQRSLVQRVEPAKEQQQ